MVSLSNITDVNALLYPDRVVMAVLPDKVNLCNLSLYVIVALVKLTQLSRAMVLIDGLLSNRNVVKLLFRASSVSNVSISCQSVVVAVVKRL